VVTSGDANLLDTRSSVEADPAIKVQRVAICNRDHGCRVHDTVTNGLRRLKKSRLIISTQPRLYLRDSWKFCIAEFSCQRMAVKLKRTSRFTSFPVTNHGPINPIDRAARLRRGDAYPFTFALAACSRCENLSAGLLSPITTRAK
jgi:hypothetical protein